jgi:uncharacterized membrane protein YfcA
MLVMPVILASMPAAASAASASRIDVPAVALRDAVVLFGMQAGVTVGLADAGLAGIRVRPVRARLRPAVALERMLRGTPATFVQVGAGTFRILRRNVPPPPPALVFAAAFLAFLVSAVAGGGAGLVLVPLLRLVLPIASIPAALSIGTAASSISRIHLFRASIRWDVVRRFVPTALPAAALGAWMLTLFEPAYVEFLLGCFLLLNLPALFRRDAAAGETPLPLTRLPLLGASAGLLSGFTGAVGVVFNRAYHRLGMDKSEIVATRATNEVLLHLLKIALYAAFGLLPRSALVAGAMVAAAALLASLSVQWVLPRVREDLFRRAGLLAMVLSGVAMFSLSGSQILRLHDAWVSLVAPGDEHELQLYWGGARRLSLEREAEGQVVVERAVPPALLPPSVRAAIPVLVPDRPVTMIEEVRGAGVRYYEFHYRIDGREVKIEVAPDGMPRRPVTDAPRRLPEPARSGASIRPGSVDG